MFKARLPSDANALLQALGRSLALIEFDLNGNILTANENFCRALGYELAEIKGRHHSMFVDAGTVESSEYREFWARLGRGEPDAGEYRRLGKGGREVWIAASYNPVRNRRGRVVKVVKQATDVTAQKSQQLEIAAKMDAISRAQAVIEFTPAGNIVTANANFLGAMGYGLEEIVGRHHAMFVEPDYANSPAYKAFWTKLNQGDYISAEFKRLGRNGREVWIAASYNPVFGPDGKVLKVVKYATDVTERVMAVNTIGHGLQQLARKNVSCRIDAPFAPAFEMLRTNFNQSLNELEEAIVSVAASTGKIQADTLEISKAAEDLSRRTEQQAAGLEETAAALDEITATVKKTADGTAQARSVVSAARSDAERSGEVVRKAVTAMTAIEESARQISQIIGVIDEIAFQTNLLALNAGVEAARAGEAGRGFAVVAQEVRGLAQRSADAAKEIKALISASGAQVNEGVSLVADTGQALERIAAQVVEISAIVNDMAVSTHEQSTALQEVNTAINQMDQVTQQNAAMVEQTTAASRGLAGEIERLDHVVGGFRRGASGPAAQGGSRVDGINRAVPALKHAGRGGAMRAPVVEADSWDAF